MNEEEINLETAGSVNIIADVDMIVDTLSHTVSGLIDE